MESETRTTSPCIRVKCWFNVTLQLVNSCSVWTSGAGSINKSLWHMCHHPIARLYRPIYYRGDYRGLVIKAYIPVHLRSSGVLTHAAIDVPWISLYPLTNLDLTNRTNGPGFPDLRITGTVVPYEYRLGSRLRNLVGSGNPRVSFLQITWDFLHPESYQP